MEKDIIKISKSIEESSQVDSAIKQLLKHNKCIKVEDYEINHFLNLPNDSRVGFLISLAFNNKDIILPIK